MNKYLIKKNNTLLLFLALIFSGLAIFGFSSLAATTIKHTFVISGGGNVKNLDGGAVGSLIKCGTLCSRTYSYSTTPVTYQATPSSGYRFGGWKATPRSRPNEPYDYTTATFKVSRIKDWFFTAYFIKTTTHTVQIVDSGKVSGSGISCSTGNSGTCSVTFDSTTSNKTYTAAPNTNYKFVGWDLDGNGQVDAGKTATSVSVPGNNTKTIKAIFALSSINAPVQPVAPTPAPTPTPKPTAAKPTVTVKKTAPATDNNPAQVEDKEVPSSPKNLKGEYDVEDSGVNLSWEASTDNVGVSSYEVERSNDGLGWQKLGSSRETSYSDFIFQQEKEYQYRVRAVDAANNFSEFSAAAKVLTGKFKANVTAKEGGEVADQSGYISVKFPSEGASEDIFITIEKVSADVALVENQKLVGGVYEIKAKNAKGEEIKNFSKQVDLKIKFDKKDIRGINPKKLSIYYSDDETSDSMMTVVDRKKMTATTITDHFSYYYIAGEKTGSLTTFVKFVSCILLLVSLGFAAYFGYNYYQNLRFKNEHKDDFIYRH